MADYKDTIFLPKTSFAMKANLKSNAQKYLDYWQELDLYNSLRNNSNNKDDFILHDGPPYANGHLHMGHALNKIIKDAVVRSKQMMGFNAQFVPGWDCHGLPIEWMVETQYRKKGINKDDISVNEFRNACRDFADKWIAIQKEEFRSLGINADWQDCYTTMQASSELAIVKELGNLLLQDRLFCSFRPVMWSIEEETTLAEAEIEYHDHISTTIWVKFPIKNSKIGQLSKASCVIWTTTPWTIPANRAICYNKDLQYILISINKKDVDINEDKILVATNLLDSFIKVTAIDSYVVLDNFVGSDLEGIICHHPWRNKGYNFDVPMIHGDHVTDSQGTGFVHTAPGHGYEDYCICKQHNIEVPDVISAKGIYHSDIPIVANMHITKVANVIISNLQNSKLLIHHGTLKHSYPHSWRSKKPLIYLATLQWFVDLSDIRDKAMDNLQKINFFPGKGEKRLSSMVVNRDNWCISRQRCWGIPITIFVNKKTKQPLKDKEVFARTVIAIEKHGIEYWFNCDSSDLLGDKYHIDDYEKVNDILDVWFESGCSHNFLAKRKDDQYYADLYLEGSDQHRGWFQSSLLVTANKKTIPAHDIVTHGFVLDKQGNKMSKSLGNVISPLDIINEHGADILRLWVLSCDYSEDSRISNEAIKQTKDLYRKLRNTIRFLLGALHDFSIAELNFNYDDLPGLEKWILHRVAAVDVSIKNHMNSYKFFRIIAEINDFCSHDLSSFYFDIRKDSLYCDHSTDETRKAARFTFYHLFSVLIKWLSPCLVFTTEEAWLAFNQDNSINDYSKSIHLELFDKIPTQWTNNSIKSNWEKILLIRSNVMQVLEEARTNKLIGSSLQADIYIYGDDLAMLEDIDMSQICIVSNFYLNKNNLQHNNITEFTNMKIAVEVASGDKCQRCWHINQEINTQFLCKRCDAAIAR